MVQPAVREDYEIANLASDGEHDGYTNDEARFYDAHSVGEPARNWQGFEFFDHLPEDGSLETGEKDVIDLTATPDVDIPPSDFDPHVPKSAQPIDDRGAGDIITEGLCLQLVQEVFPDISVDHVLTMIRERSTDLTRNKWHSERIVNELLERGTYPKEAESVSKKRRRTDSEEISDYENDEHSTKVPAYDPNAIALLKDEFINVPARHIENTFKQHKTLLKSYLVLEGQLRTYQQTARTFVKPPRPRTQRGTEALLIEQGSQLPKELRAAKKKTEYAAAKRRRVEEMTRAEEANLRRARRSNQMGECQCCFTEHPLNRMISCSGNKPHFFCKDCPKQYVKTEMGQSRCRPTCFASTECKGTFSRAQLQQVLDQKTFERLEHMQQQQDLAAAGLDFLSECPFCDFKAECPPVEVDREFRCQNKRCGKTSCRLCNKETHIPLSCEEAKKEDHISLRHVIEEAMSAALIRKCNKCQQPFVKEYGCNKMSCSHCGNKQCYVCSKNVSNYEHFGDPNRGKCPLHNNVEDLHEQAVNRAADEAMAKVRTENPELSQADLMIQVSDRVKQAEAARRERANEHGFPGIPAPPPGFFGPEPGRVIYGLGERKRGKIVELFKDHIQVVHKLIWSVLTIIPTLTPFILPLVYTSYTITILDCTIILYTASSSILWTTLSTIHTLALFEICFLERRYRSIRQDIDFIVGTSIVVSILTTATRALFGLHNAVGAAHNGAQAVLMAQHQNRVRMLRQDPEIPIPFVPIDHGLQAAHNRFQHGIQDANFQTFQAAMDRVIADREARRRHAQAIQQHFREMERQRRDARLPRRGELPAHAAGPGAWRPAAVEGPTADPLPAGAEVGAGLDGGVALAGPDADRAIRIREMNEWFHEQLRNVPRQ